MADDTDPEGYVPTMKDAVRGMLNFVENMHEMSTAEMEPSEEQRERTAATVSDFAGNYPRRSDGYCLWKNGKYYPPDQIAFFLDKIEFEDVQVNWRKYE